ncbi:MAG TPA: SIS domain-containing protein [bacterium]|nr:SIS domain-containing protein [bacterium]
METQPAIDHYLAKTIEIAQTIDRGAIARAVGLLRATKQRRGRLFILGVGGSAGNASHAVNDFRKIAGMETYAPTDNVSELTARVNDESWDAVFCTWLAVSQLRAGDLLLILSVGGGSDTVSRNLVRAMELAKERGASILGIVSRTGGKTRELADVCVLVPVVDDQAITPHAESWQGVLLHLLVNLVKD